MSSPTFNITNITTVPSDYSWDLGSPLTEYEDRLIDDFTLLRAPSLNSQREEFVGYAPFMTVTLSSTTGTPHPSSLAIRRIFEFGDYYNSQSNVVVESSDDDVLTCHVYVMPGLYSITMIRAEYIEVKPIDVSVFKCIGRYCLEWYWKELKCEDPNSTRVTWMSAASGSPFEKRWKDRAEERCDEPWANSSGLYVQPLEKVEEFPLFWQWYNYYCQRPDNLRNKPLRWSETAFQQNKQLTWADSSGPCIDVSTEERSWIWNDLQSNSTITIPLSWDQITCDSPLNKTWNEVEEDSKCFEYAPTVVEQLTAFEREKYIRVLEIPPNSYLEVQQPSNPENRLSPLTVRLSPKFTRCGSFPIERIDWDLGDGTPVFSQKRWDVNRGAPFTYNNIYNLDWVDPRNYDVIHTYRKTPESEFSFYPSITAYAGSTHTTNCAAGVVGPLKLKTLTDSDLKFIQNEMTDEGNVLIGELENSIAVWKFE